MTAPAAPAIVAPSRAAGGGVVALTGACYSAMAFLGVGFAIVGVAAHELHLLASQVGILVACQQAGFAGGVIAGGLARSGAMRARILAAGCLLLALCLLLFFRHPSFALNALLMAGIGIGMGTFEGTTDALLIQLYKDGQSRQINISHFFVTLGATGITAYLALWPLDWRTSVTRIGLGALVVGIVFLWVRVPEQAQPEIARADVVATVPKGTMMGGLFAVGVLVVGAELGAMAFLPLYLVEHVSIASSWSKAALLAFLVGVAAGRMALGVLVRDKHISHALLGATAFATVAMGALFAFTHLNAHTAIVLSFLSGAGIAGTLPLLLARGSSLSGAAAAKTIAKLKLCIPVGGILTPILISRSTSVFGLSAAVMTIPICAALATGIALMCLISHRRAKLI